jgi:hypothetical protein
VEFLDPETEAGLEFGHPHGRGGLRLVVHGLVAGSGTGKGIGGLPDLGTRQRAAPSSRSKPG